MISKKENIAEYILQMWQMEDLVRAFKDDEALRQNTFLMEVKTMMEQEGIMESGHTQVSLVALEELVSLHAEIYQQEATYRAAWLQLMPQMVLFKAKTNTPTMSDMEACFTFLYDIMLLRMQKKEISAETQSTQEQVSRLIRYLASTYAANLHDEEATV